MAQSDFPRVELSAEMRDRLITELESKPGAAGAQFLLVTLYKSAGAVAKAETIRAELAKVAAEAPAIVAKDHLTQGKQSFLEKQYEEAADHFAASPGFLTGQPEAIYFLARSHQMLAAECFRAQEQVAPESWHTHAARAEAYHLRNDEPQAINEYETAARLKPEAVEIYEALGELYIQNNQAERARTALEKALKLEPARARALYLLGELYVNGGDEQKAIPYLRRALRYDANLMEAHAYLGRAYLHEGQPADAAAKCKRRCRWISTATSIIYRAYSDLGKAELARAALKKWAEMRKGSLERDRDKLDRWMKN